MMRRVVLPEAASSPLRWPLFEVDARYRRAVVRRLSEVRNGTLGKRKWADPILQTLWRWPQFTLRATLADGDYVAATGTVTFAAGETRKTVVVQAGPEFKVLAESSLGDTDEIFWATPAVAGDALLIRSSDALYCIRENRP
jgi:hypothetical protein